MRRSREEKKQKLQLKGCSALCCSSRFSVSSSEDSESSNSDRFPTVSSIAHAMVQERLDQMIRERQGARQDARRRARGEGTTNKFIVMVAMEKSSYDPREDFRESMVEMIMANRISEPKDLRCLLDCYVSMNSDDYRGVILEVFHEGTIETRREARTILKFLRQKMDGLDGLRRRKSLKERLGLKGMACCGCGATWGFRHTTDEEEGPQEEQIVGQALPENGPLPVCLGQIPAGSGMNLAAALEAERHFRAVQESDGAMGLSPRPSPIRPNNNGLTEEIIPRSPLRVSLMRLLTESDCGDAEMMENEASEVGNDSVCCVCMRRKKGAAFIPCGHTLCRVCSRELWLNRGSCPLCNQSILEILDIF